MKVIAVVVFLNLLIASMNSTVQKIQDKQDIYWKFARAGKQLFKGTVCMNLNYFKFRP